MENNFGNNFGQIMRLARVEKRITLREISEQIGIKISVLADIERGDVEPSAIIKQNIANVLGIKQV